MPKKEGEDDAEEGWKNCEAKRILYTDLLAGLLTTDNSVMGAKEVYELYKREEPSFEKVSWKNFPERLKRLRNKVTDKNDRSARDAAALQHDRTIYPKPTHNHRNEPIWEGSVAQKFLEKDIDEGKHLLMEKKALFLSRPEYQLFDKNVFRGHVYQELKKRKFIAYCKTTKRGKEYGAQELLINKRLQAAKDANGLK